MTDEQEIERLHASLTNHTPSQDQIETIESLRERAKRLAEQIIMSQEPSRERSLALTKLEEAVMWAVKGIVLP